MRLRTLFLLWLVVSLTVPEAPALQPERDSPPRPKIGLALSGGGARGLAHIGVLKVLEEAGIQVDIVTGASMGSILGSLYAIGYSPAYLERFAIETNWLDMFNDKLSRRYLPMQNKKKGNRYLISFPVRNWKPRLPAAVMTGHKIYGLFTRLMWPVRDVSDFKQLPRPFACTATDIGTGEVVVLDSGSLPNAVRISMALPSVFAPIMLDGRLLVDGGVMRNLPAEEAIALGADFVIGVDVSSQLLPTGQIESFLDIGEQSLTLLQDASMSEQRELCDILITPDLVGIGTLEFLDVKSVIEKGEQAARLIIERLEILADSLHSTGSAVQAIDSVRHCPARITSIEVRGLSEAASKLLRAELGIHVPSEVTAEDLERAIGRLYSSTYFKHFYFRFKDIEDGTKLIVQAEEEKSHFLHTGLRYDSFWGAGLLLNASIRNLLTRGSLLEVELSLDERRSIWTEYAIHPGILGGLGIRVDFKLIHDHIDLYRRADRASYWETESAKTGLFFETVLSRIFYAAVGLNGEWFETSPNIGPPDLTKETGRLVYVSGDLWFDTLDRSWFPTRGTTLRIRGETAGSNIESEVSFNRALLQWLLAIPVHRRVTMSTNVNLGSIEGDAVPLHYSFFAGGINSHTIFQGERNQAFHGYHHEELSGRHLFTAALAIQIEVMNSLFATLHGNTGLTTDNKDDLFREERMVLGYGVSLGADTPGGPVEFFASSSRRHDLMLFLSLGYRF